MKEESFEVLLAILKKRKKVTFYEDTIVEPKRAKLDPVVESGDGDSTTVPKVKEVPRAKEIQPSLSHKPTNSLSVLADTAIATSNHTPSNDPPNSLPDLVTDTEKETADGADCLDEEEYEEMSSLEDIDC